MIGLVGRNAHPVIDAAGTALSASQGHLDRDINAVMTIGNRAQQHRQADAGNHLDFTRYAQLQCTVGGRATHHIRDHQYARTIIDSGYGFTREPVDLCRILIGYDINRFEMRRLAAKYMRRSIDKGASQRRVCQKQNTNHGFIAVLAKTVALPGSLLFDRVDEHLGNIKARLLRDLLKAGRAGYINFGQIMSDNITSYQ